MKKKISVIVPIYNEEAVLTELFSRLKKISEKEGNYDFEFLMIENGSHDSSFDILKSENKKDKRFKIIRLPRNFLCDGAITAGLTYVKGEAIVIMNADLQDPPELIPEFLRKWEQGFEIVYGKIQKRHGESLIRKGLSSLFYIIINRLTNGLFPRNVSDFRLISKKVAKTINAMNETNRFMRGMIAWTGFKSAGIEFERPARFAGKSKSGFKIIFKVAMNGIFSFSYFPLRLTTFIGLLLSIFSFILLIFYLVLFFLWGRVVPGIASTITILLFLFGMLFFILGIIGEYLARIYDEVKARPNFIVSEEVGILDES